MGDVETPNDRIERLLEAVSHVLVMLGYRSDFRPLYGHAPMAVQALFEEFNEQGGVIHRDSGDEEALPMGWFNEVCRRELAYAQGAQESLDIKLPERFEQWVIHLRAKMVQGAGKANLDGQVDMRDTLDFLVSAMTEALEVTGDEQG